MAWTAPATFSAAEVVTATKLNTHLRDNMKEVWRRLGYVEFTSDVSVTTASTEASPLDVVSSGAITYTAEPIKIEFQCHRFQTPGQNSGLNLWDGATDLSKLVQTFSGMSDAFVHQSRYLTPSAASHTYKVRAWAITSTSTVHAGAGGVATEPPGYIAIWQKGGA